jgi:hypothetical protein
MENGFLSKMREKIVGLGATKKDAIAQEHSPRTEDVEGAQEALAEDERRGGEEMNPEVRAAHQKLISDRQENRASSEHFRSPQGFIDREKASLGRELSSGEMLKAFEQRRDVLVGRLVQLNPDFFKGQDPDAMTSFEMEDYLKKFLEDHKPFTDKRPREYIHPVHRSQATDELVTDILAFEEAIQNIELTRAA